VKENMIVFKYKMAITLAVTHFNNTTLLENERWRETNNYCGCIYNSPVSIKETIMLFSKIYVIEMNNETNKIIGIGLIKNKIIPKHHKIYSDNNYNRYTYYGKKRINASDFDDKLLYELEQRLFKGKNHLKRSQGIVEVPFDVREKYFSYINSLMI
jgi:hypothetical protein